MEVVHHMADLGNPAFKWPLCLAQARMLGVEFQSQVAKERKEGVPVSGFMDTKDNLYTQTRIPAYAKGQMGFGNFVIAPCIDV